LPRWRAPWARSFRWRSRRIPARDPAGLAFAKDFSLDPIVVGGVSAGEVAADLKAAGAQVIISLNYPERPKTLAPDADEPLETCRTGGRPPSSRAIASAVSGVS
jgi:hypothetical protein